MGDGPSGLYGILAFICRDLIFGLYSCYNDRDLDIIIYGPRATGKTTFYRFFTSKKLVKLYNESSKIENYSESNVNSGAWVKLNDVPGDLTYFKEIVQEIKENGAETIILYFIALPMIIEDDYLEIDKQNREKIELFTNDYSNNYTKNVESDLNDIKSIRREYKRVHPLIIFNFADLYPLYSQDKSLFEKKIKKYIDDWIFIAGGYSNVGYIIGSLANEQEAKNLRDATLQKILEIRNLVREAIDKNRS